MLNFIEQITLTSDYEAPLYIICLAGVVSLVSMWMLWKFGGCDYEKGR
jgi:hypothetical protein